VSAPQGPVRLVLFTDAVVAIAITLLVLPLVDAVTESVAQGASSVEVITGHQPEIFSFLLSFVVIARLWMVHHRMFEQVTEATRTIMLVNMAWVLTIVVLPFPTEMIGSYGDDRFTAGFYIGTILASSVCLTALSVIIRGRLVPSAVSATTLLAVALVVSAFVPGASYFALLLLLLAPFVERLIARLRPGSVEAAA
jgi:uncharacterized membrane protein